ncbi:FecR family protein [bacterium]|nr:FecR family protein [bacterium]
MQVINFIILCLALILTTLPARSNTSIGDVTLSKGNSVIEREDKNEVQVEKDLDVFSYDTVKTGKGQVAIEFLDDTRVDITQHSKLIIDEFVYDPNAKTGKLSLKATLGTVRYASGQIAKNSAQNISIKTPTATVSVRGTDFAMTIDEIGSSTIILLPSCDGNGNCFVGEISVESDAGQVILNQAFQATQVDTPESNPLKPVLLDLNESLINNLLIVQKPPKLEDAIEQEEKLKVVANALDLDFLKFDELEVDLLETEEDAEATALEIDFLDQNFLVDILEQLNKQLALQMRNEFDKGKDKRKTGTDEFGVTLLIEEPEWVWMRSDEAGNNIVLRLSQENGYTLNVVQGDIEIRDYQLGEGNNEIYINQR